MKYMFKFKAFWKTFLDWNQTRHHYGWVLDLAFMRFSLQTEKESSSCLKREQAFLLIYILEP